jgi:hypothetical protein
MGIVRRDQFEADHYEGREVSCCLLRREPPRYIYILEVVPIAGGFSAQLPLLQQNGFVSLTKVASIKRL